MPIVLLGVVLLLALRGSASDSATKPPPAASSGPAPGGDNSAKTTDDVIKGATAAVPLVAAAATTIAGYFGGTSATTATAATAGAVGGAGAAAVAVGATLSEVTATAAIQGAVQGALQGALAGGEVAGEAGSEAVVETIAAESGATLGATFAGIGFLAIGAAVIALFIQFVGPPLAQLYEDSKEWARKRYYGKAGVLANLDLRAMQLEQEWCTLLINSWCGLNLLRRTPSVDPAAAGNYSSAALADQYPRISWVSATIDFETQRLIARVARSFAIQQLHARNKTIAQFFTMTTGQTDAQNESNGVALSASSFIAWAEGYCGARKFTSWGLNLDPNGSPSDFSWAGMRAQLASQMGSDGWTLTLARLDFFGRSSGIAMCSSVGYFTFYPGDDAFVNGINGLTGTNWRKVGLWLVDPVTNGAVNPALSRVFASPQTIDAHLLDANGDHNGYFPPLDVAYLAGLNPPVQKWV